MMDTVERIRRDGYSKELTSLAGLYEYQQLCKDTIKANRDYVSLYNHMGCCWYHEGIIEKSASVVVELSVKRVVEVDRQLKKVLGVNGIEHNVVLNLNDDGERWEGDVLQNKPYGWGVLYDSENRMAYEGFRIGDVNVCYGTRYYSDIGVIEYEGEWFEGMRWGRGILYDRSGKAMFDGEWMKDEQLSKKVVVSEENQFLHNRIEELIVSDDSCTGEEWKALDLSLMPNLKEFIVGDNCFSYVYEVKLMGLNQLERVVIGEYSFGEGNANNCNICGHFYLRDCERVKELKIDNCSFQGYSVCEIDGVPSLEVIELGVPDEGGDVFYATKCFELKSVSHRMSLQIDLPKLRTLIIGYEGFCWCRRFVLESKRFVGL